MKSSPTSILGGLLAAVLLGLAGSARAADDDAPLTVPVFGRPTELTLSYEASLEDRRNFDLDRTRDRDRRATDQELKAAAKMRATDDVTLMVEGVLVSEVRKQPATKTIDRKEGAQRGQLWAQVDRLGGTAWSVQAGRIPLTERRTWWWDEDIDAVRVLSAGPQWRFETGFGRELSRKNSYDPGIDLDDRGVRRWFGQAAWTWSPRQVLEAFWLHADDRSGTPTVGSTWTEDDADARDGRLTWLGLRSSGQALTEGGHRWGYWADVARVSGRETTTALTETPDGRFVAGASTSERVRGQAIDVGGQWTGADALLRPTATLAWARGSRDFRQTGLQENKVRLGGVKRLQRYGELLDPQLSNLSVTTAGLGVRVLENTSLEVVWHRYRQTVASSTLAGSRLSEDPQGTSPDIGREIDVLLAWRESGHVELTLAVSRFTPGAAFAADRRDPARAVALGLNLNF